MQSWKLHLIIRYLYVGTQNHKWGRNAFKMSRKTTPPPRAHSGPGLCRVYQPLFHKTEATRAKHCQAPSHPVLPGAAVACFKWLSISLPRACSSVSSVSAELAGWLAGKEAGREAVQTHAELPSIHPASQHSSCSQTSSTTC